LRLNWSDEALDDLGMLAERAPVQTRKVLDAARQRFPDLGRYVPEVDCRYWAVPPQGLFYKVDRGGLLVIRV
jgi:hypothetical protein